MFNPAYLTKSRNGIFHLRWPLPKTAHPHGKPSTLKLSLRTRDPRKALRLSRLLSQIGEQLNAYGIRTGMRYEQIRTLLRDHFQDLLQKKRAAMSEDGPMSEGELAIIKTSIGIAEEAIEKNLPLNFLIADDDREVLSKLIEKFGLDTRKGNKEYGWLQRDLPVSYRDYLKAVLAHNDQLRSYDYSTDNQPTVRKPHPQGAEAEMNIEKLAEAYAREKKIADSWAAKTELEKADHIALLAEILGGATPVTAIDAMRAKEVKDTLLRYPKNRSKNPATRGKPLDQVLGMAGVGTIQVATINKYLQTYNDMFEWGRRNGFLTSNAFAGLTIRQGKARKEEGRQAFTPVQMERIIKAVTGARPDLVRKDFQKWGPLIGAYTGARLNEIAQLYLDDIKQIGGIWCFDINDDGEGKNLKTSSARRLVPIHSALKEYGFLDYVNEKKKLGILKLFPDFTYTANNGWGRNLGRWFNEAFLPKLDIKSDQLVFHSLRHTVITRLSQKGVEEAFVKALVGHQQQGVTQQVYFKQGYTIDQLNGALQKLDFALAGA